MLSRWIVLLVVYVTTMESAYAYVPQHHRKRVDPAQSKPLCKVARHQRRTRTALFSEKSDKKNKGVYSRPSAAIEKGSGFFIPGLEGPRVRLVFGLVVLVLTAINHGLSSTSSGLFSEELAVAFSLLLLLQAAIEFGKEDRGYVVSLDRPDEGEQVRTSETLSQRWAVENVAADFKDAVQWSAASYISLTPATHMMLLEPSRVLYRLGSTPEDYANESDGTRAALETVQNSKSGRVSLPSTHLAVMALVPPEHGRCVVLQRINDSQCWLMTSDQLLAAFTPGDLKWLGQLATHASQHAARS